MNQAYFHLLVAQLPVPGSIAGALVLAYGLRTKSNHAKIASCILLIISSIGAGIFYLAGEAAEETVEKIQGILKTAIDQHEDFAIIVLAALIIPCVISLIGVSLTLRKASVIRFVALSTPVISFVSFALVARPAYLGGKIRHTEFYSGKALMQSGENKDDD
ncbi:hypothetical protein [Terrimonas pollutisoli]|uniref:hypothetical protein n=1 Tax=Terrimonas pollutisoli TaxID=3034147 RepID=UPI0023ECA0C7|nr:hypothetical protein [Terrimonas sp. H1YJ31]